MKYLFLLSIVSCIALSSAAQSRHTVSGYIKDAASGETIIGATISINGNSKAVSSNQYGFYSITLTEGEYTFISTHIGYQATVFRTNLNKDTVINISLTPGVALSEEVIVTATKRESNIRNAQMGKITLPIEQIRSVPAFLGEVDLLKVVQLLPGVRNAGEGSAGIYVRGGGPDQNLIMLDDAVVYNTGHLFGFFSIFNADAIKNVSLIKGGMPAQYGGRLSSVLDVSMKEGNNQKMQVEGGIGLIASRFSIQGPIKKDKSSFIISARRTYVDAIAKPFVKKSSQFYGSGYYFYDLNAKFNYKFSEKDRIYLSGYFGRDVFDFKNSRQSLNVNIPWGNATGTFRWNHVFNNKLFANTTAVFNDYKFSFTGLQNNFQIKLASGIRDFSLKQDFDFYPFSKHKLKFGGMYTYHRFTPSIISGQQDTVVFNPLNAQVKFAHEVAAYVQDDWDISSRLKANIGLRYSAFQQVGPYKKYITDADGNRIDSTVYSGGKAVKTYGGFEPRLTLRYSIDEATSVKASVTRNLQYIHLVSNAGTTLPTDIWVPSTYKVKPQQSWLYAAGLFRNFKNNTYETSIEFYYKQMQNQIEYREGYTPNTLSDTEDDFVFGKGWSYGSELFINKVKGRFTGWIGYTFSYTWRKFPALNAGNKYPAKYDRRNDMSIVAMYELNKKWKLSGSFVYGTGNAATLPQRFYIIGGVLSQEYSSINQYRLPSYHRLDLSAVLTPKKNENRKWKTEWVFSIYNVYSRQNPYFIYFDQSGSPYDGSLKVQAKQVSIFPVIPAVTWNFKF
ncbi:TonB-dependent receptor [Ferruginibacter sp. HRS2-29]|uniref:TonB-dependent receptor n=1 Tax=Ferruginibacter sp. HRS2-29 TaxID=2487334 RepID=UPI0020CD037E|nr:TonB-dependent receptor [Ferruginibacter sp. HRS2-29]MCP9750627.1 TonB-dependent receptor [Ferruginibacter sp. HRS2-29]